MEGAFAVDRAGIDREFDSPISAQVARFFSDDRAAMFATDGLCVRDLSRTDRATFQAVDSFVVGALGLKMRTMLRDDGSAADDVCADLGAIENAVTHRAP